MAASSRGLVLLDRANQLLAEASSLEDIKEVRNVAESARTFAKAAQLGLELQNRAAELKLRAERKAGAFLAELHLQGGNRRSKGHRVPLKLDDFGITNQQSKRWQLAALVPEPDFEKYVRGKNQLGQEVTAAGLLRMAKWLRPGKTSSQKGCPKKGPPFPVHASALGGRAELLALVGELKNQVAHLANLLQPLATAQGISYELAERRFIGRLAQDIEQSVEELQRHLWNGP